LPGLLTDPSLTPALLASFPYLLPAIVVFFIGAISVVLGLLYLPETLAAAQSKEVRLPALLCINDGRQIGAGDALLRDEESGKGDDKSISIERGESQCTVLWSLLQDRTVLLVAGINAIFSFGVIGYDGKS
jgi:hypothetical protein